MADVVLDACVLIDLEQRDRRTELWIEEADRRRSGLLVAGATYIEVWRGYRNGQGYEMRPCPPRRRTGPYHGNDRSTG